MIHGVSLRELPELDWLEDLAILICSICVCARDVCCVAGTGVGRWVLKSKGDFVIVMKV